MPLRKGSLPDSIMKSSDHPKSEPELVQITIDGNLNYAFKWWDEQDAGGRAVRYVVKDPTCGVISYMLIVCANRIPEGTALAAVKFYAVEKPSASDYWPAETAWANGETDIESAVRICSPETTFQAYRGLPGDLEQMIREHKAGKRHVHRPEKTGTPLDALHAVHADVRDLKTSMSPLPGAVALLGKGVETVRLNIEAIAKNEYELRQENSELQRLHSEGFLKFATQVNGGDFTALIYIMALGNRKKAADALGIPHRSFYDRVDKWPGMGSEYKRMFRLVEWRKNVGRQLKVRLEDSLLSGEPNGSAENPETIRDVMTRMKEQEVDSRDYPSILRDILDAMSKQNPANWRTVNKEVIGIITEELPQ